MLDKIKVGGTFADIPELRQFLQDIRNDFGYPVVVTDSRTTESHNKKKKPFNSEDMCFNRTLNIRH